MHAHRETPIPPASPPSATAPAPTTRAEVLAVLRPRLPERRERYGVESLAVFGSFARGDQRPESDVDVLVTYRRPISLLGFCNVQVVMSDALGWPVDLVEDGTMRPAIEDHVAPDLVRI